MSRCDLSQPRLLLLCLSILLLPAAARSQVSSSQATSPQSRIVEQVNEDARVTLRGNTHPLALPQFDQGAAPPDLPMARMLLVLKRGADQESALEKLLDDQQDGSSASYHQWLTPNQFGQQFGPSDQDIQTVSAWLRAHGFQVATPTNGRAVIEFSGTASQVREAFRTEIHKFVRGGEEHWANASDPQIPSALAPVIAGVNSLHNFPKQPMYRLLSHASSNSRAARGLPAQPDFSISSSQCAVTNICYFVGPYDFATIYNVLPLWNATPAIDGTGQSIAILGESNINLQDVRDFRSLFNLPAKDPQIILNGQDPGLVPGVETEADLDVEWSGAIAMGATIKLVVTEPTNATAGVDLSAIYAIENNVAPIISESFGECELYLGNSGNIFQNSIRQQAAAQGITFINSSGDEGSARCDPFSGSIPSPATHGLQVSGLASSPNGVAVGGTDFQNFGPNFSTAVVAQYWNLGNDPNQASARGYIPETTWNDTCTNSVFGILGAGNTPEAACNNAQLVNGVQTSGGGGGRSGCTSSDGSNLSSCAGGYAKPSWQSAPGVPADGVRDVPDVSLFASPGFMDSAYILCESDQQGFQPCSLNSTNNTFLGVGGTSASAPAFAGIMALVNQSTGSSGQGNANYVLYKMASSSAQTSHACNSTSTPNSACIFYDVTAGTIAVPCAKGTLNCTVTNGFDLYGVLSGYGAGTGYDLATGLGTVNASNLVHNWIQPTNSSATTLSLNNGVQVNITHGQSVSFSIAVTPSAAPGVVSLMGSPAGGSFIPLASFPLQNGAASGTTASLAGGTSYSVKAHYPGNGTYAPSDSALITVTVAPEPSKTLVTIPIFDPLTGLETGNTPTSVPYGSLLGVRADVGNARITTSFPSQSTCAALACPTGSLSVTDSLNGSAAMPVGGAGNLAVNSGGYVENDGILLAGGTHHISASYSGDASYSASVGSYILQVTPAATQISAPGLSGNLIAGSQYFLFVTMCSQILNGATPTGTITFYQGATPIPGPVTLSGQSGTANSGACLSGSISPTFTTSGSYQLSAKYSGDANYASAVSSASSIAVRYPATVAASASATTINLGQSVTLTATATSSAKTPAMTGTFQFYGQFSIGGPVTPTLNTDANGNQVLTATLTFTPQATVFVQALYVGDSNFQGAGANLAVNVIIPDFSASTPSTEVTIVAGQPFSTPVTFTPLSNVSSAVAFNCEVLPIAEATCAFNPVSPLTLASGSAVSTTFSIITLPPSSSPTTQMVAVRRRPRPWSPPPGWWLLCVADGFAIIFLSLWSGRSWNRSAASVGMVCLLMLVLGCGAGTGGGTGSGGGGGGSGGATAVPTTLVLTASTVKAPSGSNVTFTVAVNSSKSVTGTVSLFDQAYTIDGHVPFTSAPVINGVATFQVSVLPVGTNTITAQYSGDANNLGSQTTGSINEVITGTVQVLMSATTSTLSHNIFYAVTIR